MLNAVEPPMAFTGKLSRAASRRHATWIVQTSTSDEKAPGPPFTRSFHYRYSVCTVSISLQIRRALHDSFCGGKGDEAVIEAQFKLEGFARSIEIINLKPELRSTSRGGGAERDIVKLYLTTRSLCDIDTTCKRGGMWMI